MTPYDCFLMYSAMKLHFNQEKFDYHQYNGKVKIGKDTFEKRKDKYDFVKLVRKYSDDEMENFLLSNFIKNKKIWSKELLMQEAHDCYMEREKTIHSLSYIFKNDLDNLKSENNLREVMQCREGEYPILLRSVMQKDVHLETFVVMDSILNFTEKWNKFITDTFMWPQFLLMINKYKPFLKVELEKFKSLLKDAIVSP